MGICDLDRAINAISEAIGALQAKRCEGDDISRIIQELGALRKTLDGQRLELRTAEK